MNIDLPVQKILSEALKEGGEFADLFFEQTYSVVVVCEEDRIEMGKSRAIVPDGPMPGSTPKFPRWKARGTSNLGL